MTSRQSAAQIVIIHRRQIIVDQRIRMNHLYGARCGHRLLFRSTGCFAPQEDKYRPESFSGSQEAVTHRFRQGRWAAKRRRGKKPGQRLFDLGLQLFQDGTEVGQWLPEVVGSTGYIASSSHLSSIRTSKIQFTLQCKADRIQPNSFPGCAEYGDPGLCCRTPSECKDKKRSMRSVGLRTLKGYYNTAQGRRTRRTLELGDPACA